MSNEGEWQTAGRRRMQSNRTQQSGKFNRFHAQKRVSILEQVSNGSLEPDKAEELLRPAHYRSIPRNVYCRTTKSGAVAVYGFSTRPLVLYEDRWYKFLEWLQTSELENYLRENSEALRKPHPMREHSDAVTSNVSTITEAATRPVAESEIVEATRTTATQVVKVLGDAESDNEDEETFEVVA